MTTENATIRTSPRDETTAHIGINQATLEQISDEINLMLCYATLNGLPVDPKINQPIQSSEVEDVVTTYNLLINNVAPATPKSIRYSKALYKDISKKGLLHKLPLVRNLILLSVLFLIAFIVSGSFPEVNNDSLDKGVMNNQGLSLILNIFFLSSIAGMGVTFYLLKEVSVAVKKGTLIPEDSIYYISLIVLGIIAGLFLSEILSFYNTDAQGINLFNKGTLALVGGFSSDAIFSVLQSIIGKIKALFSANTPK